MVVYYGRFGTNYRSHLQGSSSPRRILLTYTVSVFIPTQWPRGLRRRSAAARLLRFWVRIPPWSWMSLCCKCCVLSGRGLCDGLITRPEESYRLWCVVVCDLETSSRMRTPWPALGCSATGWEGGKLSVFNRYNSYAHCKVSPVWL